MKIVHLLGIAGVESHPQGLAARLEHIERRFEEAEVC